MGKHFSDWKTVSFNLIKVVKLDYRRPLSPSFLRNNEKKQTPTKTMVTAMMMVRKKGEESTDHDHQLH
jgi:hypothetical protein